MTLAILSFDTRRVPARVILRCDDLQFSETRELEPDPPFAEWAAAYATGHWTREALLGIGLAIGNWLDGRQRWLTPLMKARAPVILVIETTKQPDRIEQAALGAPWELIASLGTEPTPAAPEPAQSGQPVPAPLDALLGPLGAVDWQYVRHAAFEPSTRLSVVRRLGQAAQPLAPSPYRLSVVFMPCQPEGAMDLSVDVQAAIRKDRGGSDIDLDVEDFGTLDGLADLMTRLGGCDVIQMSCPATTSPRPALVLEGPRGEPRHATAADLLNNIGQKPRLLVVSAYAGAATAPAGDRSARNASLVTVGSRVLEPIAVELCQGGWHAVLALPGSIDQGEIALAAALYRLLAQQVSLLDALALARPAVAETAGTEWHRARLLLGPEGGGPLVGSTAVRPTRPDFIQDRRFLDPGRTIRIADDYPVSLHRRAFQGAVAALRDTGSPGIVVHGGDSLLRATFVSRVLQRMAHELRRLVVTDFDAAAILRAVRNQTARAEVEALAEQHGQRLPDGPRQLRTALRAIVEGPCQRRGAGAFVLVLHEFERTSTPERGVVFRALLDAFDGAGTASRLLITRSDSLSSVPEDRVDASRPLAWQSLDAPPPRKVHLIRNWRWLTFVSAALVVCAGLGTYIARRPPDLPPFDAGGGIVVAGPDEKTTRALCDELKADRKNTESDPHCMAIDDENAARIEAERVRATLLVFIRPARSASVVPIGQQAINSFFGEVPPLDLSAKEGVKRAAPALRTLAQLVSPRLTEALVRCAPASTGPLDNIDLLTLLMEQLSRSCREHRQKGTSQERDLLLDVCPAQAAASSWSCRAAAFLLKGRGAGGWIDLPQFDRDSADPHIAMLMDLARARQACEAGDVAQAAEVVSALVLRWADPCARLTMIGAAACALNVAGDSAALDQAHRATLQDIVGTLDHNSPLDCDRGLVAEAYATRGYWRLRSARWREAADDYAHAYHNSSEPAHQLAYVEALLHQRDQADQTQNVKRALAELGTLTDPVLRVQLQLLTWILQPDPPRAEQLRNAFAALSDGAVVYADAQDPSLRSLACPHPVDGCVYDVLSAPRSNAAVGRLEKALGLTTGGESH